MHQRTGHLLIKTIQKMEQQNAMTSFTNLIIDIPFMSKLSSKKTIKTLISNQEWNTQTSKSCAF
jgi:hypothetical protein